MTETSPNWHKSTYSGNTNDACVEVADNLPSSASGTPRTTPGAN